MKKITVGLIAVGLIAVCAVPLVLRSINQSLSDHRVQARYTFEGVHSLTEDLAVAKGRDIIVLLGYDANVWHPMGEHEMKLPYGVVGPFLRVNNLDNQQGIIQYIDSSGKDQNGQRILRVQVKDARMEVEVIYPK
jgi:hypothetical protein